MTYSLYDSVGSPCPAPKCIQGSLHIVFSLNLTDQFVSFVLQLQQRLPKRPTNKRVSRVVLKICRGKLRKLVLQDAFLVFRQRQVHICQLQVAILEGLIPTFFQVLSRSTTQHKLLSASQLISHVHSYFLCTCSGIARKFFRGEQIQRVFLSPSLPSLLLSSPSLHFPSFFPSPSPPLAPLRSRTPKIQLGSLGSAVSCPAWYGAEPHPKSNLVHYSLKI